jgi:transcriptional regulator with XRE-family HTH domain
MNGGIKLKPSAAFGKVLAEVRKKKGISQEKFAEICEMDRTFISMMERGLRQPTLTSILTIGKALNISPSKLIDLVRKKLEEK